MTDIVLGDPLFQGRFQQGCHGLPFIHKDAEVPLWLSEGQDTFQRYKRSRDVALHLVSKCQHNQDLDCASCPLAFFCCLEEALQESDCLKHGVV
ncbi:hypothetical protein D3C72_1084830 [compost metagenome]